MKGNLLFSESRKNKEDDVKKMSPELEREVTILVYSQVRFPGKNYGVSYL